MSAQDIDRFVIEGAAVSGGMGSVFRGRNLDTGRLVAIKIMHDLGADAQRFAREATILAQMAHPAIVGYVAHGIMGDGRPFLVMDWVDGETLDARLSGGGLTMAESLAMGRRVADALGYAHALGVVHRDVKPSNLMLPGGRADQAAVLDFGIARPVARVGNLTETGAVIGTPAYMAPEQARGERDIGPRADIFALGCVLYECLTGRVAFEGKRFLALTAKIVLWDPPPPRALNANIPTELDALINRMIAKDPAARPADGAEVSALLEAIPAGHLRSVERRSRQPSPPTMVVRKAPGSTGSPRRLASIVVATTIEATDAGGATLSSERLDEERRTLAAMLAPHRARPELLHDGSIVAVLDGAGNPRELAVRAVQCARTIRRAYPNGLIAITTDEIDDRADLGESGVHFLLEDTVAALARAALALVFAGVTGPALPAGAIHVDERTAALLERDCTLIKVKDGYYLGGED